MLIGAVRVALILVVSALVLAAQGRGGLKIVVVDGEDAVNIIQQKTAVAPVVEVRDRNDQPVAGALVTFSVRGGKLASFAGGSPTVTVTTNAAGRAAAAAINPLSSGGFQIQVQAAFQGQTAAAAIAQTNVMTAAEAAAAASASSSGGAGAGSTGGAAGGSGGGLSATTIGVIGAGVAGGALAATQLTGDEETPGRTYSGAYDLQIVLTVTNPDGTQPCTVLTGYSGTLRMTLTDNGGAFSGTAEMQGTKSNLGGTCFGSPLGQFFNGVDPDMPVGGSAASLGFNRPSTFPGSNNVTVTETLAFTGALAADVITGTLTVTRRETGGTGPTPRIGNGTALAPVTLR